MPRNHLLRKIVPFGALATVLAAACADSELLDDPNIEPAVDAGTADTGTVPDGAPPPRPDAGTPDGGDGGLPPSSCGNGTIDSGESCDDGNRISGDGCSSECAQESAGAGDLCPGQNIVLSAADASTSFVGSATGTSAGLYNQYQGTCGGGSGPDAVFRIDPPALGRATVRVTAQFPVVVSARSACDTLTTELSCAADTTQGAPGTPVEIGFPVLAQQPVFVFVDGVAGTSGEFTIDVDVNTAVCGNGFGEQPEECDDGNAVDGDGCSATCALEDTSTPGACPGMGVRMAAAAGAPGVMGFSGDTLDPSDPSSDPASTGCPARAGSNRIYAITPAVNGTLAVDLLAAYVGANVQIHRSCDPGDIVSCVGAAEPLTPLRTSARVFAEQTVFVVVDSATASTGGLYTLQAKLTTDACGDAQLGSNEECDDGNVADGDGCSATCAVERNAASYTCPGQVVALNGTSPVPYSTRLWGTTRPASGETAPVSKFNVTATTAQGGNSGSAAPDVVYQVTSDVSGYVTATLDADFAASMLVKPVCVPASNYQDRISHVHEVGTGRKVFGFPVTADVPAFLIVDGYASTLRGAFALQLDLVPAVCGNGRVDGGETCDDGNVDVLDGCDEQCRLEPFPSWGACATAPELAFRVEGGRTIATTHSGNINLVHTPRQTGTTSHTLGTCHSVGTDAWYKVVAPGNGSIIARVASATFNSSIGVRPGGSCPLDPTGVNPTLACDSSTTAHGGQQVVVPVAADQEYLVILDSRLMPDRGLYDLEVEYLPAGCGDTVLTVDEQCDDGNQASGDGCSSTCQLESLAGANTCPGLALTLAGDGSEQRRGVVTVDTSLLTANTGGTCGGASREGVMRVRSDVGGILDVRATRRGGSFFPVLYSRDACGDPATEFKCAQGNAPSISMPIVANHDYFVFLDGMASLTGVAQVDITVTP